MAGAYIDLEAMSSLVDTMGTAASDLRGSRSDLAGVLGGVDLDTSPPQPLELAASWVEDQVPGLRRRLALAQHVQGSNPGFGAGARIPIDESKLSTQSPTMARQQALAAAAALKSADGEPSKDLVAQIAANQDDPYYAAAFAGQFTPDELASVVKRLSQSYPGEHRADEQLNPDEKAWNDNYRTQILAISGVVATATRSTSPDLRMPADWGQQWSDAITADVHTDDDGSNNDGHALALSLLLKNGTFGTDFLTRIADDAYHYEREKGKDGDAVWAPKTGFGFDTVWDPDNPASHAPNQDVMANILKSLGHNPLAAQEFFDGDDSETVHLHGQDVTVDSKLKYFIQDRGWGADKLSDDGDGLGDAIRAGSTYYRDRGWFGSQSATIASQTMSLIGDKDGDGAHGWSIIHGSATSGWHMPAGLRSDVADIMASYTPDLYRMYHDDDQTSDTIPPWVKDGDNPVGVPGDPYGMALDKGDLAKVLQSLGSDQDDLAKVTTSVMAYNQYQLGHVFDQIQDPATKARILEGKDWPPLTAAMRMGPNVLQNMLSDAFTGGDREEKIKNANTEAMNKFIDVAGDFPVLDLAKVENPVAGWAFDAVKGEVLDKLKGEPVEENAKLYTDEANKQTEGLTHNFQNVMLQHGFYDPDVIALLQQDATKDGGYNGPPPGAVRYDADGKPEGFDFTSEAYQQWKDGLFDQAHPTNGTMPGGQLSEEVKQIYVTNFGVKF